MVWGNHHLPIKRKINVNIVENWKEKGDDYERLAFTSYEKISGSKERLWPGENQKSKFEAEFSRVSE